MKKSRVVAVGILSETESFVKTSTSLDTSLVMEGAVVEVMLNPAEVISQADHPMTIPYNGLSMIIPPRGRNLVADLGLLGALPKAMVVVVPRPELRT